VNKKMEKQPEAEPAQIIQHVPSMLTEVHSIVTNPSKMSYAEVSKKSLRTGLPVANPIVSIEKSFSANVNDVGLDGEVVFPAPVPRESTPPLEGSPLSPSLQVESLVQNEVEKEKSPPLVPATAETKHTSQQTKPNVLEKKTSQSLESGGSKQAVEQVPVEKGSFAVAEDQYMMKRTEVVQPQPQFQSHAIDVRSVTAHPVVQQQGGVGQFPYMMQPGQMSQQWGAQQSGHMNPYQFPQPQQMVPSHPQMYNPGSYFPVHFIGTQPTWNTGYSGIPSDAPPGYPKQQYQNAYPRGYQGYQAPPHVRLAPSSFYTASGQPISYGSSLPPHFGQAFPIGGESQLQQSHVSSTGQTDASQGTWTQPQESQAAWPGPAWNQNRS